MTTSFHSAVIEAPAEAVWRAVRDFHDVAWAAGVLTRCAVVGDRKGDQVGARRILNDQFHETLVALDDQERSMKYSLDDGPPPVSREDVQGFVARLRVVPITETEQALMEFSATWVGADEPVRDFSGQIYKALLAAAQRALSG